MTQAVQSTLPHPPGPVFQVAERLSIDQDVKYSGTTPPPTKKSSASELSVREQRCLGG